MDEDVKLVALAIIVSMMFITIYPILSANKVVEPFSELAILGPNGKLGDYPKNIIVGNSFKLFIYVGNQEENAQYYEVRAKLDDKSMNTSASKPLNTSVIAYYDFVLPKGGNETIPVSLSIPRTGQNLRLVFELWRFSPEAGDFIYDQRWNQLWMNVTG